MSIPSPATRASAAGANRRLRRPAEQPFFHARWTGSATETRGVPHALLGRVAGTLEGGERDGVFAEWAWDGATLTLRNDRYGFFPLFYAVRGNEVWVSPSIHKLVAEGAPTALDHAALAVFLRMGGFVGEDTPFAAVRQLPPRATFAWRAGRLEVRGEYLIARAQPLARDAAMDGYAALFREAMRRIDPDPERTLIPLTGGRDSRHIFLELCASGRAPRGTVTTRPHPPKSDDEVEIAAQLSRELGVPHLVLEQPTARVAAEWEKNEYTDLGTIEHGWVMPLARHLEGRALTIHDGIAGDTLSQSQFLSTRRLAWYRAGDFAALAEDLLGSEGYLPAFLPPRLYEAVARPVGLARLRRELERHAEAPNPMGSFRFYNRTRRTISLAPHAILAQVARVETPYLDHALFDFLASLPGDLMVDRRFHTDTIARAYPEWAHVPYEVKHRRAAGSHTAHFLRVGADAMFAALRSAHPARAPLLRRAPLAARLARAMAVPGYRSEVVSLALPAIYLMQLESLADAGLANG